MTKATWPAGWGSGQKSFPSTPDRCHSLTVPVYLRVRAPCGQAPARLWLLLYLRSLPCLPARAWLPGSMSCSGFQRRGPLV